MSRRLSDKQLHDTYGPRIVALLGRVATVLGQFKIDCGESIEVSDEESEWWLVAKDGEVEIATVQITIAESEYHDGTPDGINFQSTVSSAEGVILNTLTPYNYSDACWVSRRDREAVAERFDLFDSVFDADLIADHVLRAIPVAEGD